MNSTMSGPVAAYLDQVRAELSDLPAGELEDVLEDVTSHLDEVAHELDDAPTKEALETRLGTPRQYADELRSAAGYPPRGTGGTTSVRGRAALRWAIVATVVGPIFVLLGGGNGPEWLVAGLLVAAIPALLGVRALRGENPSIVTQTRLWQHGAGWLERRNAELPPALRRDLVAIGLPAWWVLRGAALGGGLLTVVAEDVGPAVLVGAMAGAVGSVWLAHRTQADRRWLWFVVPLNVVAAVAAMIGVLSMSAGFGSSPYYVGSNTNYYGRDGLTYNGTQVTNVFPFDQQGKPISARLYDQDGQPISLEASDCDAYQGTWFREPSNVFPQRVMLGESAAESDCRDSDKPPFDIPPATPTVRPTTPSVSTSVQPIPTITPSVTPTR